MILRCQDLTVVVSVTCSYIFVILYHLRGPDLHRFCGERVHGKHLITTAE